MRGKLLWLCGLCVAMGMAAPAAGITVVSQGPNTTIMLGVPFVEMEFENPLAPGTAVKGYPVLEWRDADYAAGPWYDDWVAFQAGGTIDGCPTEIWMRNGNIGQFIRTTTTVASTIVSIHLNGDGNDGLADVKVDGTVVASFDMYTASCCDRALIIVDNLANTTHTIEVHAMGMSTSGGNGDDVATFGAAALAQRPWKWEQLPDVSSNGIDIRVDDSDGQKRVIADDWECTETSLLTDVHFWGSWKNDEEGVITKIHLSIHSDDPVGAGGSDPNNTYSKPDELKWECDCYPGDFIIWAYATLPTQEYEWWWDPATGTLLQNGDQVVWEIDINNFPSDCKPFLQEGTPENTVIYWLDISVQVGLQEPVQPEFGWKTRQWPDHFMDDAVFVVDDGTQPIPWIELKYPTGHPYHESTIQDSVDMAFRLTFQEEVPPDYAIEFSLDIGSDTELSDPNADGDEGFDPGDVYYGFYYASPVTPPGVPGGRDGIYKDDVKIFAGIDPNPNPPDAAIPPVTAVPVGTGDSTLYKDYFDLDGHDQVDSAVISELEQLDGEPALEPILVGSSQCIYELPYALLLFSYDDDQATGWPSPAGFGDVPVTVPSPTWVSSYGTTAGFNEVLDLSLQPAANPPYPINIINAFADEETVHFDMTPNPDNLEADDDDVDSLDAIAPPPENPEETRPCPYWLFTVDHEAFWGQDSTGAPLDPGHIYYVFMPVPAGSPKLLIHAQNQLGLQTGTDVDAFELVLIPSPQGLALAAIFSVDEDDPLTVGVDESGGLDPRMIYYSYLTGVSNPLLTEKLADDVDALTAWGEEIGTGPVTPVIISMVSRCFHDATNTFNPQDIPLVPTVNASYNSEPRLGGPDKIVITFNESVVPADGLLDNEVTLSAASGGVINSLTLSPTGVLVADVSGFTDDICLTVSVSGMAAAGNPALVMAPDSWWIVLITGDSVQNYVVNIADVIQTKIRSGQAANSSNFRFDTVVSGVINLADVIRQKLNSGNGANCP